MKLSLFDKIKSWYYGCFHIDDEHEQDIIYVSQISTDKIGSFPHLKTVVKNRSDMFETSDGLIFKTLKDAIQSAKTIPVSEEERINDERFRKLKILLS